MVAQKHKSVHGHADLGTSAMGGRQSGFLKIFHQIEVLSFCVSASLGGDTCSMNTCILIFAFTCS